MRRPWSFVARGPSGSSGSSLRAWPRSGCDRPWSGRSWVRSCAGRVAAGAASTSRTPSPPDPVPSLAVDVALRARDVDYALHRDLQRLAPCGTGNPEPLVAILGLTVTRAREAGGGGHTQLVLKRRLDVLDGIAFGWPELAREVTEGALIDVVAQLRSRRFGGIESLQLD